MTEAVSAICFPDDDASFAGRVRTLLTDGSLPGEPMRAVVEALLRDSYPLAVVSVRHSFAALDQRRVWYVYRDGGINVGSRDDEAAAEDGSGSITT